MKTFTATQHNETEIELEKPEQLEELYTTLANEEDFILVWREEDDVLSKVMIATHLGAKVKDGSIKLTAREEAE